MITMQDWREASEFRFPSPTQTEMLRLLPMIRLLQHIVLQAMSEPMEPGGFFKVSLPEGRSDGLGDPIVVEAVGRDLVDVGWKAFLINGDDGKMLIIATPDSDAPWDMKGIDHMYVEELG